MDAAKGVRLSPPASPKQQTETGDIQVEASGSTYRISNGSREEMRLVMEDSLQHSK